MKKKSILVTLIILIISILVASIIIVSINGKFKKNYSNDFEEIKINSCDLSFGVLSDIHDNGDKFTDAIDDLYGINPSMDALILNGDSVDQGLDEQYADINKILEKKSKKLPNTIIKNMGNHEYYNYSLDSRTEGDINNSINMYLKFSNNDKIYHDKWINGYHFISLGSDNTNTDTVNYTSACISDEEVKWLNNTLSDGYIEGKPIFVFLHQPVDMKFFNLDVTGIDRNDEIKNILKKYPEVILFTSHTHITPDANVDEENEIKIINTGSVNSNYVTDKENERGFKEDKSFSNGIYVEIRQNDVRISGINFKDNSVIYTRNISN